MNPLKSLWKWYFTKKTLPYWGVLAIDCAIVLFSGYMGTYIYVGGSVFVSCFWPMTRGLLITLAFCMIAFKSYHTYKGIIRYSTFIDLFRVFSALVTGTVLAGVFSGLVRKFYLIPNTVIYTPCIHTLFYIVILSTLLMWMERIFVKHVFDQFRISATTKKAFIYGVKAGGIALAKSIHNQQPQEYTLVGFVSPEGDLQSKFLLGVQVRRDGPNLVKHMREAGATDLLVSPLMVDLFRSNEEQIDKIIAAGIRILMIPTAEEWDGKSPLQQNRLKEVEIEDLLPREKIEVDMNAIGAQLTGRKILITGAAGSIGSEMVRQVAIYHPAEMILIDQAETPMHDIRLMMAKQFPDVKAQTIVATITDQGFMEQLFSIHRPEYVFHAAAYKHVPMMEDNPVQAVRNNISGTRIIADLAVKYGTKKFVMISTDKAVNPTNVMGCSKRICEIYCQSLNMAIKKIQDGVAESKANLRQVDGNLPVTQFVTTRFGNVLGSNGSVIPLFKEQIKQGGPLTVTHPDIIRYFMLIPEACKLVLEAGTMGKGGEIFVFDMGKPVKIVDLAKRMIALSGAKDVEIRYTGLRDGEKLYEEVLSDKENTIPTKHPKIMVAQVREYDYEVALKNEIELQALSGSFDNLAIVRKMKEIVPEYISKNSIYQQLDQENS